MANYMERLIKLIHEGRSCNEICEILNITNKQLYTKLTNLQNKGFFFNRTYNTNGDIFYEPIKYIIAIERYLKHDTENISLSENNFRCLLISDLHFGSVYERLDLVSRAFDYCVKNSIHIIFCCGDLIDGSFGYDKSITSIDKQIKHFINDYPFDKSILTFAVAGDHDLTGLFDGYQDIREIIRNYRHDIILNRYGNSFIKIKNDKILLYHKLNTCKMQYDVNFPIVINGHLHKYVTDIYKSSLCISVPSLSNINNSFPTAIEMNVDFENDYMKDVMLKQIYFGDKVLVLSENQYDLTEIKRVKKKILDKKK